MERLRFESPARYIDCLECSRASRCFRQAHILMRSRGESVAFFVGNKLLAVAYLWPHSDGSREFCLSVMPAAADDMLQLCRFAHLTFAQMLDAEANVMTFVRPGHRPGERMARLVGFKPVEGELGRWRLKN